MRQLLNVIELGTARTNRSTVYYFFLLPLLLSLYTRAIRQKFIINHRLRFETFTLEEYLCVCSVYHRLIYARRGKRSVKDTFNYILHLYYYCRYAMMMFA